MKKNKLSLIGLITLLLLSSCEKADESLAFFKPDITGHEVMDRRGEKASYVDLSTGKVTVVHTISWDLAFFCGNDFRVMLNADKSVGAYKTDKFKISDITPSDLDALRNVPFMGSEVFDLSIITGDLKETIFGDIADSEDQANVFLVRQVETANGIGETLDPIVVKVYVENNNYILKYASCKGEYINNGKSTKSIKLGEEKTVTISKDPAYNFKFISLKDGKEKDIEPKNEDWTFQFTASLNIITPSILFETTTGEPHPSHDLKVDKDGLIQIPGGIKVTKDTKLAHYMNDLIIINYLKGVEALVVDGKQIDIPYEEFKMQDAIKLTLSNERTAVMTKWRSVLEDGIYIHKYIVMKDKKGTFFKMRFIRMGIKDGGERGVVEFEYENLNKISN